MTWQSDENLKTLYGWLRNAAFSDGFLSKEQMENKDARSAIMTKLIEEFEAVNEPIRKYNSAGAALLAFRAYLRGRLHSHEGNDFKERLSLSVTVHYGAVSVSIGIEDDFFVRDSGQRAAHMKTLRDAIDDLHREQARDLHTATPSQASQETSAGTVWIDFTCIRKEQLKGKDRLRVIGGKWIEHGVPLYVEAMEAAGLKMEDFPAYENPLKGKAHVELKPNGNPHKVLELVL